MLKSNERYDLNALLKLLKLLELNMSCTGKRGWCNDSRVPVVTSEARQDSMRVQL